MMFWIYVNIEIKKLIILYREFENIYNLSKYNEEIIFEDINDYAIIEEREIKIKQNNLIKNHFNDNLEKLI